MVHEMFESAVRPIGDLAGVFEYDGEVGYFYLYEVSGKKDKRVLDSIHIASGIVDFSSPDVSVEWDQSEERVGLFIHEVLWAVFDVVRTTKYGGDYQIGGQPAIPPSEVWKVGDTALN